MAIETILERESRVHHAHISQRVTSSRSPLDGGQIKIRGEDPISVHSTSGSFLIKSPGASSLQGPTSCKLLLVLWPVTILLNYSIYDRNARFRVPKLWKADNENIGRQIVYKLLFGLSSDLENFHDGKKDRLVSKELAVEA